MAKKKTVTTQDTAKEMRESIRDVQDRSRSAVILKSAKAYAKTQK